MATDPKPLLAIRGLTKSFPGVKALQGVDFTVRRGEVHALMGENGAGKSTLIKVLTGVYQRDSGTARFDGAEINAASPKAAEAFGISTVYQEVNLIPHLSVAENICLGRQPTRFGFIHWGAMTKRAEAALARVDVKLDVTQPLSSYSIALQQMIAIARALDISGKLLVLDEPTSSLDEREVEELFKVIRKLRAEGLGIVIVTHFMDQVYAISDRITVLRDGQLVGEYETAMLPRTELVSKMIGKELSQVPTIQHDDSSATQTKRELLLELKNYSRAGSVLAMNLTVGKGEVVGLAGLLGSGRTETARLIFGIDKAQTGEMLLDGKPTQFNSPRQAIRAGFAFTPENRKVDGIIPRLSIRENIVLALQARRGAMKTIPRKEQEELADKYIKLIGISTPGAEQLVVNLSGGNQQKVLLARWLAIQPRLLILDEPTRGIDVGAKAEILKLVQSLREQGMSILFISSELEEVARDSQRVVVLRDRAKVGELTGSQISEENIMHTIAGHSHGK
jgi:monosaccharide-transporting ATPase